MPLTHYVTLGRSGLRVSPFCLGAMTFGEDWGWGSSVAESESIMARFLERGGNFIDTANVYTKGHSEKIIGDFIGRDRARRDRIVIATKFFGNLYPGDPNGGGAGRKTIVSSCEESLRRLQTDYIDLYWMHCWDRAHADRRDDARARRPGARPGRCATSDLSDTPAWKVAQAQTIAHVPGLDAARLAADRILAARAHRGRRADPDGAGDRASASRPGRRSRAACCRASTRARTPPRRKPIAASASRRSLDEKVFAIIDELARDRAASTSTTPAAVALAWVQGRPGVASTIIGARRLDQLEQNLAALDVTLTRRRRSRALDALSKPTLSFPMQFLKAVSMFSHGGTTINGEPSIVWPLAPRTIRALLVPEGACVGLMGAIRHRRAGLRTPRNDTNSS